MRSGNITPIVVRQPDSSQCRIKGNINRKGERIYHRPGERWYDQTKIDPAKGERWFCSENEARAAGWRAALLSQSMKREGSRMTLEVLLSGTLGALLVFALGYWREQWHRGKRIKAYKGALRAEITESGRIASEYGSEGVAAPLYRLPTVCYGYSFPGLLGEGVIEENEAAALVKFYAEVETFNRGLDLADLMRQGGDEEALNVEVRRNLLKARRIAAPSGELFAPALSAISE